MLAEPAKLQKPAAATLKRPEEARAACDAAVGEIVTTQLASMPVARRMETTEGGVR